MFAGKPLLFVVACALCLAGPVSPAIALVEPEIADVSCQLFLSDAGTNPLNYLFYRVFLQGFLAARIDPASAEGGLAKAAALMPSIEDYCRGHATDKLPAAFEAVLKTSRP